MNTDFFDKFSILIQKNHKNMNKLLESLSGKTGLNASSLICLITLSKSEDGKASTELCEICCYDKALISRNIKELTEKGYICRNEKDKDLKRGYRLILTDKGFALTENIKNNFQNIVQEITRGITDEDIQIFYDISVRLSDNLAKLTENIGDKVPTL